MSEFDPAMPKRDLDEISTRQVVQLDLEVAAREHGVSVEEELEHRAEPFGGHVVLVNKSLWHKQASRYERLADRVFNWLISSKGASHE